MPAGAAPRHEQVPRKLIQRFPLNPTATARTSTHATPSTTTTASGRTTGATPSRHAHSNAGGVSAVWIVLVNALAVVAIVALVGPRVRRRWPGMRAGVVRSRQLGRAAAAASRRVARSVQGSGNRASHRLRRVGADSGAFIVRRRERAVAKRTPLTRPATHEQPASSRQPAASVAVPEAAALAPPAAVGSPLEEFAPSPRVEAPDDEPEAEPTDRAEDDEHERTDPFDLGLQLEQRGDLAGARAAYLRADRERTRRCRVEARDTARTAG